MGWVSAIVVSSRRAPGNPGVIRPENRGTKAAAQIEAGIALNSRTVTYDFPDARVQLMKVVSLPEDELGLWVQPGYSDSPRCCSFFPRIALEPSKGLIFPVRPVVISSSSVADGRVSMRMFDPDKGRRYPFTVDLAAIGVPATLGGFCRC